MEHKLIKEIVKETVNRNVFILHEAAESGNKTNLLPFQEEIKNNITDLDQNFKDLSFSFVTKLGNKMVINVDREVFKYDIYTMSESK